MPSFPVALAAALTVLLPLAPSGAEELGDLLEKVAEAHGGREELLAVSGYRARGKVLSVEDGLNGSLKLLVSLRGAMRAEIRYPDRSEVRILSGGLAWNGGRREQGPAPAAMAAAMRLQYHRLAAPFELAAAAPEDLELVGTSEEGWTMVRRDWDENLRTIYEIDPETGLIPRIRGELRAGDETIEFIADSHDLRRAGGILFPFRMTTYKGDEIAAETILDRVKLTEEFPEGAFVPSGGTDM